jgi:hypothetical protein
MEADMGKIREEKGPSPHPPKFEEVYPHYEFSELVRIAVLTAEWLRRFLRDPRVQRAIAAGHRECVPPGRRTR